MPRAAGFASLILALGIAPTAVAAQGLPDYKFPGLRGYVVADENGHPLAGVSVLAVWASASPPPYPFKTVRTVETRTRSDGAFELAPWQAPQSNPMTERSPALMFFSPGRVADSERREDRPGDKTGAHRLPLFEGPPERRASQLRKFAWVLGFVWAHTYGEPYPRVLSALDDDWRQLPPEAQANGSPSLIFDITVQSMRYGYEQELLKRK